MTEGNGTPVLNPGGTQEPNPGSARTFTQADIDAAVAATRRKLQEDIKAKTTKISELEMMQGASAEDMAALRAEKEELDKLLMSEKEARQKALETEREQAKAKITQAEQKANEAIQRYQTSKISAEISLLAKQYDARNASDFRDLIFGKCTVKDVINDRGEPTGKEIVVVKTTKKKEDGTIAEVELPIEEYVKELYADEDRAYLFNSRRAGGTGAGIPAGGPGGFSIDKMSTNDKLLHGMGQKMKQR